MYLKTESVEKAQPLLIVNKKDQILSQQLKKFLLQYNAQVYISPDIPKNLDYFDHIFIVDDIHACKAALKTEYKNISFISHTQNTTINNFVREIQLKKIEDIKIILLDEEDTNESTIERLLWFSFSPNKEIVLNMRTGLSSKKKPKPHPTIKHHVKKNFKFKRLLLLAVFVIGIFHLIFLPFLVFSSYDTYKAIKKTQEGKLDEAETYLGQGSSDLIITKKFYPLPHATLLLFSLAILPDNIIAINERAQHAISTVINVEKNSEQISGLFLKREKNSEDMTQLLLRLNQLKSDTTTLESDLSEIQQKIPSYSKESTKLKDDISVMLELLAKGRRILEQSDSIFAKGTEKKYLLIFANNMELRPGGGFIGSFGIVKVHNYTIDPITIYDVYDADGQLKAHIEPPEPIKKYLNVEHWFLRDSAFSPDFLENYTQAKFFLDREMNERNFSGALLLTTSAVQNLLSAFPSIYLPDFKEEVNDKNFYIKTQYYAEKDFFPGSIQKKSFLASLARALFINLETASLKDILKSTKKSFDEKQMVFYSDDPHVQEVFDSYYWAGRQIKPQCSNNSANCITDYVFPVDANVGGNKANFFISRRMELRTTIDSNGTIKHRLLITFKNDAPSDVYPGGSYHNYFQIYLPRNSGVKSITRDGVQIDDIDQSNTDLTRLGMSVIIKPKEVTTVEINYQLDDQLKRGEGIYQLVIQKQIGSTINDLTLNTTIPDTIHVVNQNFTPLVKNKQIIYNTNLSADKIFFIELLKE